MSENIEINNDNVDDEVVEYEDMGSNHSGGGNSCCSSMICALVGFLLIIGCTYGHYANEKAAVERSELYDHVEKTAFEVNNQTPKADFQGKLVHWTSSINIEGPNFEDTVGKHKVSAKCVKLERYVEMWQVCERKETKTIKSGDRTTEKTTDRGKFR